MEKVEKRSPGRPPKVGGRAMHPPLALRLPEPVLEEIDEIVEGRKDMPDRTQVIRELIVLGLRALAKGKR